MKKYLFSFLLFFMFIPIINASVETYNRESLKNYGVNKKWKITDQNKKNVLKTPNVDASKKIYDFSDILTEEEEKSLKEKIDIFIKKYKTELIIVTYDLPYSNDKENDTFASDFYDYNDFGINFDLYSGIVLFRNTYEADRYYDMYTFGKAQLYFSHTMYDIILDGIYYDLSNNYYFDGFSNFIDYVNNTYVSGIPDELKSYKVDKNGYLYKIYKIPYVIIIFGSLIISLILTIVNVKKNKMIKRKVDANEYLEKNGFKILNSNDIFIRKKVSSYTESSSGGSSGGGGGGYSSSSGSSGGGFSSGGGRHG